jgi:hypothetical protein
MRISIKTKKRRLLIATGDDTAVEEQQVEWIQMNGGDFQVVPEEEIEYVEEGEEDWIPDELSIAPVASKATHNFGFAVRPNPNTL